MILAIDRGRSLAITVLTILIFSAAVDRCVPVPAYSAARPVYEDSVGIGKYQQPDLKDAKTGNLVEYSMSVSCCGYHDAYWTDEFEADGDQYVAIVTDPRDDDQFRDSNGNARIHIPIGTRLAIPNKKIITFPPQPPNTTGHGWVWVSIYKDEETDKITSYNVFCYLAPDAS